MLQESRADFEMRTSGTSLDHSYRSRYRNFYLHESIRVRRHCFSHEAVRLPDLSATCRILIIHIQCRFIVLM